VAKIKAMIALFFSGFTMKGRKDMKTGEACDIVPGLSDYREAVGDYLMNHKAPRAFNLHDLQALHGKKIIFVLVCA
jgi:hypothetical protein